MLKSSAALWGIVVGRHDTRDVFFLGVVFVDVALLVAEPFVALDCWRRLWRATTAKSVSSPISVGETEFLGPEVETSFHSNVVGSYLRRAVAVMCGCDRGEVPSQSVFASTLGRASIATAR
ncbi:hypothetical protein MRX96_032110 [Rhipicephalus microplus]